MTHRDSDIAYRTCPSCGQRMYPGEYVCGDCLCLLRKWGHKLPGVNMKIVAKARFKPQTKGDQRQENMCLHCVKLAECRECLGRGLLLACEAADQYDWMRQNQLCDEFGEISPRLWDFYDVMVK